MVFFRDFVLSELFFLTVHVSTEAWRSDGGQPRVIGLPLPIVAALGDDVILPCRLEPSTDAELQTVEWLKPDAEPDPADPLSRVEYVHLYRGRRENADMKIQAYVSRTEMFADQLKHGNISLKIMNVTLADEGRCKCLVPQMDDTMFSVIQLVVKTKVVGPTEPPPYPRDLRTPDPQGEVVGGGGHSHLVLLVLAVVVLLILSGGYVFKEVVRHQTGPAHLT